MLSTLFQLIIISMLQYFLKLTIQSADGVITIQVLIFKRDPIRTTSHISIITATIKEDKVN